LPVTSDKAINSIINNTRKKYIEKGNSFDNDQTEHEGHTGKYINNYLCKVWYRHKYTKNRIIQQQLKCIQLAGRQTAAKLRQD